MRSIPVLASARKAGQTICKGIMKRHLVVLLSTLLLAGELVAQTADANMSGYVTDTSGSGVPNAKVNLKNTSTGVTRSTQTNGTGFYPFTYVLPAPSYE